MVGVGVGVGLLGVGGCGEGDDHRLVDSIAGGGGEGDVDAGGVSQGDGSEEGGEAGGGEVGVGGLVLWVPSGWTREEPANAFRLAQFGLPGGGELVVSGGMGGGVEANLARWEGQMRGGSATRAEVSSNGLTVHVLEAEGTYSTGLPSDPGPRAGMTLMGAVIEGGGDGLVFVKLVAERATVDETMREGFAEMVMRVRPGS